MLGYALANGKDFGPVADLWRNQADIQALLRGESDTNTNSILNSGYYQQKLEECFASLAALPAGPGPYPSEIAELDLFVTGTDANGSVATVFDDVGHAIDVKNHRALFKLSFRGGRTGDTEKNDFKKAKDSDLGKLCRLTSCFPVAFEPVHVQKADEAFFRWGKLRGAAVYLDGGILNNKPFTSTIDQISRRTANRDVERFLIYVEPDPEVFTEEPPPPVPPSPNVAQAAFGSLVSIPGYQSIAGDLAAIEAHNERVESMTAVLNAIGPAAAIDSQSFTGGSVYEPTANANAYYACRLIQLRDAAVEGILNDGAGRGYMASLSDRRSGRILVSSFARWRGGAELTLRDFDVCFRMRRAQRLSEVLMDRVKRIGSSIETGLAWDLINHFFKLYEILEWSMQAALDSADLKWKELSDAYPDLDLLPAEEQDRILSNISEEKWGLVRACLERTLD